MTIFGKKTLLLFGVLLAQQFVTLTAAWAADPAAKPQKTFDQCLMNGRIMFKDGARGCIENYPGLMTSAVASWYASPQWDLGATRPNDRCPAVVGGPNIRGGSTEATAIQVCEDKIRALGTGGVDCNCDSVFSIAKTLTRDQFERYAKDFLPTGSGRITGFSTAASVADASAASAQANVNQDSSQKTEAEQRLQAQTKLEEERKRQELAKAEEARRQQEQQLKLAEVRRQEEINAKLAAEREAARQKELEVAALSAEVARLREQLLKSQAQTASQASNRKALVIGNDQYKAVPKLVNARSDAKLLADRLQSFGYSVTLKYDLNERDMKSTLRVFKSQVSPGDEVAIFFAGHGVQLGSANYLLPIDVAGESEDQIKDEAIPLQRILDDMTERKAKLTLALVDACRDNPFKTTGRSIGSSTRGLAPTSAATGQMVVYSAGTGQQALDKVGANDKTPNGLFMRVFAKEIDKSGVTIDAIVRTVRNEVARLARTVGHEQVPAIYDQVEGEFYLKR
jgi:hypothetical protein